MIDDPELWALFRAEAEEHLQLLDSGLLRLETDASDQATLDLVFRGAHSLKGAARMMGAHDVEKIAHGFEDALVGAAKHGTTLQDATVERLYNDIDALRASIENSISTNLAGEKASDEDLTDQRDESVGQRDESVNQRDESVNQRDESVNTFNEYEGQRDELVDQRDESVDTFNEYEDQRDESVDQIDAEQADAKLKGVPNVMPASAAALGRTYESSAPAVGPGSGAGKAIEVAPADNALASWKIETMRVDTSRLDVLLAMAGELVVSTKRAAGNQAEFEQAQMLREEMAKLALQQKRVLRVLEGELGSNAPLLRDIERMLEGQSARWDAMAALIERLRVGHEDMVRLESVVGELEAAIRGVRLLPLSTLFGQFPRSVRDLAKLQNKRVNFAIEGGETTADKRVIEGLKDPLMHMIRNAVDHGIESPARRMESGKDPIASLQLRGSQSATHVIIELEDDGRGLDTNAIGAAAIRKGLVAPEELATLTPREIQELIFAPGFSTAAQLTDVSGRGVGLDVVRDNVQRLRGTIDVISRPGQGCTFRLIVPLTLATTRVLLVRAAGQLFALPIESIASVLLLKRAECYPLRGRPSFSHGGEPVPTAHINTLLDLGSDDEAPVAPCVVLRAGDEQLGLRVEAVIEEQEIILKPLHSTLENLRHIAGATILGTGDVCLLLAPDELIKFAARQSGRPRLATPALTEVNGAPARPKSLLLAEDSIVTRTQEKRILEGAGYLVTTAVDGLDAWQKLTNGEFDALVSDIEMPNLDGIALAERVRSQGKYDELPIILVTSLSSEEDRVRGLRAGANAYITKGSFDQKILLETLQMLI